MYRTLCVNKFMKYSCCVLTEQFLCNLWWTFCDGLYHNMEVRLRTHQSTARQTALAWRSRAGAVQAVCNGPPMSEVQGTTVHDRLLRLHLRHRSSAAPTVRRLPSAACAATPPFDLRSLGLFFSVASPAAWNSLPVYLRDSTRSVDSFRRDLKTLLFSFY